MIRKQLYLDEDLNEGLRRLAQRTGRSEADHVRAAVRAYLEPEAETAAADDPLLGLVGLVADADGPSDVAARHDDYLYGSSSTAS
jgi:hypothetical protein